MASSDRDRRGSRYTPPGASLDDVDHVRARPPVVRIVAALIVLAMVLAPLAFLFTL